MMVQNLGFPEDATDLGTANGAPLVIQHKPEMANDSTQHPGTRQNNSTMMNPTTPPLMKAILGDRERILLRSSC